MNEDQAPHARAFDLPGWPCPPRVRDIPKHKHSWGYIDVRGHSEINFVPVAQDELGYLWVNGNTVPRFRTPNDIHRGALVFHVEVGIGLWVHPQSLKYLPSVSRLDMPTGEWLPVNAVAPELPSFIKETRD